MINLASEIPLLLFRYQSIYVPELGSFIRINQSSSIKKIDSNTILTSPKESVVFKDNLIENPTLINHFVFNLNVSFEEVEQQIKKQVTSWKEKMDKGEEILFQNFGKLKKSDYNFYQFHADESYCFEIENQIILKKKSTLKSKFLLFFLFILIFIMLVIFAVMGYLIYTFGFELGPLLEEYLTM
jgi:hypothetical protein